MEPTFESMDKKMDVLIELHRYVIKWLVICVCVIAMGTKLVDSAKELTGHMTPQAHAVEGAK